MYKKDNDIEKSTQNIALFKNFIIDLKKDIKLKPKDDKYIALFTLEVTWLDYCLKGFLSYYLKDNKYFEKPLTLGQVIGCCNCALKTLAKNKVKDKLEKSLLNDNYIASFIKACYEINKLRNKLFHNLFKDSNINLRGIARSLKKKIEIDRVTYYKDEWEKHKRNKTGLFDDYKPLIDDTNGLLPKKLTIEMVTEISGNYLKIAVQHI